MQGDGEQEYADYQAECQAEAEAEGQAHEEEQDEKINQVTEDLYKAYASSSGYLFGIPPKHKSAVSAIVKVILMRK